MSPERAAHLWLVDSVAIATLEKTMAQIEARPLVKARNVTAARVVNGYYRHVKMVNIAEIKNRLSYYLERVKRGETVLVMDRKTPVARIVPLSIPAAMEPDESRAWLKSQVDAGALRPGHGKAVAEILDSPPQAPPAGAAAILIRERRQR